MTNRTWVCFDCRLAQRHPTKRHVAAVPSCVIGGIGDGEIRCTKCQQPCRYIGPRFEVPSKRAVKSWNRLREEINQLRSQQRDYLHRRGVRTKHKLERQLADLRALTPSPERDLQIKELEARLECT